MSAYGKRGLFVRALYLVVAGVFYLLTGAGRGGRGKRVVLCYHGVPREQRERFGRQMTRIADRAVACAAEACGTHDPQDRSIHVCVTFDDAFENLLENALPILDSLGIPATVFVVPGNLGRTPQWRISPSHPEHREKIMTAEQLRGICGGNTAIGSHTQTHPALTELSAEQIRWELAESKRNLEEMLGREVVDLALPHGACSDVVLDVAREKGYRRVYTLEPQVWTQSDGIAVPRFSMSPNAWGIEFYLTCAGAYAWLGPWRRFVRAIRRRTGR